MRRQAARQARSRLGAQPRSLAFGLCYPLDLRDGSVTAPAAQDALSGLTIAFAPVRRYGNRSTWCEGSVADLADSLRNADLSRQRVADTVAYIGRNVAEALCSCGCAADLARALALSETSKALNAAALVASLMLSNASQLHHRLRLVPSLPDVTSLETALLELETGPSKIRDAWRVELADPGSGDSDPAFARTRSFSLLGDALQPFQAGQTAQDLRLVRGPG